MSDVGNAIQVGKRANGFLIRALLGVGGKGNEDCYKNKTPYAIILLVNIQVQSSTFFTSCTNSTVNPLGFFFCS